MTYFLSILSFYFFIYAVNAEELLLDFGGKRKIIQTHKFSENSSYRSYVIDGTFTDHLGNYGSWETIAISKVKNKMLIQLVSLQ